MRFLRSVAGRTILLLAVLGPGIITAFADNDAGGVATYSVAAATFGYQIITTLIPITVVLIVTQEIGGRIAIATGKGLADIIREQYGIRIALVVFLLLVVVNFGVVLQDVSGLKSALQLFNLNVVIFLPLLLLLLFLLLTKANYRTIEKFFLVLIFFYVCYIFSAFMAKPDWNVALSSLVIPRGPISIGYLITAVAVLGTTVTAWGQFFINSSVKDKHIGPKELPYTQAEIIFGSILSNVITFFMMVAVAATLFIHNIPITDGGQAALAIKPFAGNYATVLFGLGLLVAGFLGCAIVPLSTAYAFSEFFGFEGSLDESFSKSRIFYILFIGQLIAGLVIVLIPNFSLFNITIAADFLNGVFLPIIFFFLYKIANNKELLGQYTNKRWQNILLVGSGVIISVAVCIGIVGKLFS